MMEGSMLKPTAPATSLTALDNASITVLGFLLVTSSWLCTLLVPSSSSRTLSATWHQATAMTAWPGFPLEVTAPPLPHNWRMDLAYHKPLAHQLLHNNPFKLVFQIKLTCAPKTSIDLEHNPLK